MNRLRGVWIAVAICAVAGQALAESALETPLRPDSPDTIGLTLRLERTEGDDLMGTEVDWVRRNRKTVFSLGASANRVGDASWRYLKGAVAGRMSETLYGSATVELGTGDRPGADYDYRKVRARVTRLTADRRLELFGDAQAYDVDQFSGTLIEVGASYRFVPAVTAGLSVLQSVSGNWDSRLVSAKISISRGLDYRFGATTGDSAPDLRNVAFGITPATDYSEIYAGVGIPLTPRQSLAVYGSLIEQGPTRKRAVILGWQRPLPDFRERASK